MAFLCREDREKVRRHYIPEGEKAMDRIMLSGEELPPPLSAAEEAEALRKLTVKNSADAREALILHNLRLVVYIAEKYAGGREAQEDLISVGTIGLIKAVSSFRPEKKGGHLSAYAGRCIENEILRYLRDQSTGGREYPAGSPAEVGTDLERMRKPEDMEKDQVYRVCEKRMALWELRRQVLELPEKERLLVELRYGMDTLSRGNSGPEGLSQEETARRLGCSQSYASRLERRVLEKLRRKMVYDSALT